MIDNSRLVGIVSEGDLLRRAETGTERRTARRRWRWFDPGLEEARDYVKSRGRTVGNIMTPEGISVGDQVDVSYYYSNGYIVVDYVTDLSNP